MGATKENGTGTPLFGGKVPQMPEGYYSGDKPNPNLRAFVEQHVKEHPCDALHDDYDVLAFDRPIEATKATAIYGMHAYWSKKPHDAIQQYIKHYTKPGDLVLDPFCGSGSTALAALMDGRAAIAIDRSPAATFITRNYCTSVGIDEFARSFEEFEVRVGTEIDWLYETRCDRCGGPAHTLYTVYSMVFQCPECGEQVPLYDCAEITAEKNGTLKQVRICPSCLKRGKTVEINGRCRRCGSIPVEASYECRGNCSPLRDKRAHNDSDPRKREYFKRYDVGKILEIESKEIPNWYPQVPMIKGQETCVKRNLEAQGIRSVADLFTKRNLWALSTAFRGAAKDDDLRGLIDASIIANSKKAQMPEVGGYIPGNYSLPAISTEREVMNTIKLMERKSLKAKGLISSSVIQPRLIISTQSACDLSSIPAGSVDYIFTDPPYGGSVQYGELNFVWEAWLQLDLSWHSDEVIVNEIRHKTEADWANMMRTAVEECYRVLKPGRWLSLCYHDTSEGTWTLVQDIVSQAGFVSEQTKDVLSIDTGGRTYNQYTADKVTKRDLVMNFRKPRPGETAAEVRVDAIDDGDTLNDKVRAIITDYLTDHAGATKDRIWDTVVSRMVREGQMQPHDFEALLRDVANAVTEPVKKDLFNNEPPDIFGTHVMGHWYLKSTAYMVEDETERSKEDAAGAVMRSFIDRFLGDNPEQESVHYSDLFEHYLTHVTDKSRRKLAEWLPDYFFFTADGTWRLPATSDEEELKAHERKQGTGRRIRRYLAYLQHHADIPEEERPTDVTLADWIRHCKRAGMYAQGSLLYEQGGLILEHLTEEQQVNVEEDYGVCVRKLAEQQVVPKYRRKAKEDADDLF